MENRKDCGVDTSEIESEIKKLKFKLKYLVIGF